MSKKVSNFSDLIQHVTANCLLHLLGSSRHFSSELNLHEDREEHDEEEVEEGKEYNFELDNNIEGGGGGRHNGCIEQNGQEKSKRDLRTERLVLEMEILMSNVFDAVSAMKRAYVNF